MLLKSQQNSFNILFLGGGRRVSLANRFLASLGSMGIKGSIYSYDLSSCSPISKVAKVVEGFKWNDKRAKEHIRSLLDSLSINLLVSNVDPALLIHADLRSTHDAAKQISEVAVVKKCISKKYFQNVCQDVGLNVIPKWDGISYPLFVKLDTGSASVGAQKIYNEMHLNAVIESSDDEYILQKLIRGREFTVDAYIDEDGHPLIISPRLRQRTAGGEVVVSSTVSDQVLIDCSRNVISKLELKGPITMQFIQEYDSRDLFLMEVNPRLGGGVIASLEAGADICTAMIKKSLGMHVDPISSIKALTMQRYFSEVFYENCD